MEAKIIDITATPELAAEITQLAESCGVKISRFGAVNSASPVSNFPNLDPTVVTAFQQATVILGTGTAAVKFVSALIELIRSARGKAQAVDRQTGTKFEASSLGS